MQDDDRAPLGLKAPERQVEQLAIGKKRGGVCYGRVEQRRNLDLDRSTTTSPENVETCADDEAPQPCFEAIRIAKRGEVPPGREKTLLDRVSRKLSVAEDEASRGVQARDAGAGELSEGVMIALPGPLHESSLVHAISHRGAASLVALESYVPAIARKVPVLLQAMVATSRPAAYSPNPRLFGARRAWRSTFR